jgi:hypothetical protein
MLFRRSSSRRQTDLLRTCPACRGRLVCPIAWEPADDSHWDIDLRCGDCEHRWQMVVDDRRAARYDVQLDDDLFVIKRTLRRLELERMSDEVEAFVIALERDLIEPADFAA